jgi:hypothetical protein
MTPEFSAWLFWGRLNGAPRADQDGPTMLARIGVMQGAKPSRRAGVHVAQGIIIGESANWRGIDDRVSRTL